MNANDFKDKLEGLKRLNNLTMADYKKKAQEIAAIREAKKAEALDAYNKAMTARELGINDALEKCKKLRSEIREHRDIFLSQLAFLEQELQDAEIERDRLCAEPLPKFPEEL